MAPKEDLTIFKHGKKTSMEEPLAFADQETASERKEAPRTPVSPGMAKADFNRMVNASFFDGIGICVEKGMTPPSPSEEELMVGGAVLLTKETGLAFKDALALMCDVAAFAKEYVLDCGELVAVAGDHYIFCAALVYQQTSLEELPRLPIDKLLALLSDPDKEPPEWLLKSEAAQYQYTREEDVTVIKLLEGRFWRNHVQNILDRFSSWDVVFGIPRQNQLCALKWSDTDGLHLFVGPSGQPLGFQYSMLPTRYANNWSDQYKSLRNEYFPTGIDEANFGFSKNISQVKEALSKMHHIVSAVQQLGLASNSKLYRDLIYLEQRGTDMVATLCDKALQWNADAYHTLECMQLPGHTLGLVGLEYGKTVHIDFERDRAVVMVPSHPNGHGGWDDYTWESMRQDEGFPIRWKPGNAWGDWLENIAQPQPAFERIRRDDRGQDPARYHGPLFVRVPLSLINFNDPFSLETQAVGKRLSEQGLLEGPKKSKWQREAQAISLSLSTGKPYWGVGREYATVERDLSSAWQKNHWFPGCPRYDGCGNLRFDFMNAILAQFHFEGHPFHPRTWHPVDTLERD